MNDEEANRLTVREYLSKWEQPKDGLLLVNKVYGPCTYVIAKESSGLIRWAFRATDSGRLYRTDVAHIIALEKMKRQRRKPKK